MGKVMAGFTLLGSIADLFSQLVLNNIYEATLDTFVGTVFIVVAIFAGFQLKSEYK